MDVIDPAPQPIDTLRADAEFAEDTGVTAMDTEIAAMDTETATMDILEAIPSFSLQPAAIEDSRGVDEVVDYVAAAPEKIASDPATVETELTTPEPSGPLLTDVDGSQPEDDEEALRKERALKLRQMSAFWEARHRAARLEYSRWSGSNTLRPNWHPAPMTSNR
jgi:hypothetical protein